VAKTPNLNPRIRGIAMRSSYKDILDFKVFDCTAKEEKITQFKMLMKDPEVQPFFRNYIENIIATSELRILKRLAAVETALGLNDFSDFEDEEKEPNLPEKIQALENKLENFEYEPRISLKAIPESTSKTEIRADLLVKELNESGKDHLTSHEIIHFLKSKLPENCKVNEKIQNIRKVKQDVLRAASQMYPNVFLSKKKTGHKEVRLILGS
jgi:hypothetical protein